MNTCHACERDDVREDDTIHAIRVVDDEAPGYREGHYIDEGPTPVMACPTCWAALQRFERQVKVPIVRYRRTYPARLVRIVSAGDHVTRATIAAGPRDERQAALTVQCDLFDRWGVIEERYGTKARHVATTWPTRDEAATFAAGRVADYLGGEL